MSASAMVGDALLCFCGSMTDLLRGRRLDDQNPVLFLAYQMPDCQVAHVFSVSVPPRLDNLAPGIPNAISPLLAHHQFVGKADPLFAFIGKAIERAQAIAVLMPACIAEKSKQTPRRMPMSNSRDAVRKVLDQVKADKRTSLTAPEGKLV